MPISTLIFNTSLNSSLQIGDLVYYTSPSQLPTSSIYQAVTSGVTKFGVVSDIRDIDLLTGLPIDQPEVDVVHDTNIPAPLASDYIMFEKDKQVNSSSLIGYYAKVDLENTSDTKIEMFSLGSEVTESSK